MTAADTGALPEETASPTSAAELPIVWWAQILGGHPDARFTRVGAATELYVAFPRPDKATVVVDARAGKGIADAVGKAGQGVVRGLAGKVLRIPGVASALPGKLILQTSESTLRDRLSQLGRIDARLSASCGPLRPNRKPVVRVLDADGSMEMVAKIGWDSLTAQLITTEGAALERAGSINSNNIVVPRVIGHENWRGLEVLAVSPLPIDTSRGPELAVDATLPALNDIAAIDRTSTESITSSGFWQRLDQRIDDLDQYDIGEAQALDIGGFHGDWSPWNTQPRPDGSLLVWDWERHASDVPVGLDLVHFLFQTERFIDQRTPREARPAVERRAQEHLPSLDVSPDLAELLIDLYLLEALARNSEGALTKKLAARRQTLVDALSPRAEAFQLAYAERYPASDTTDAQTGKAA